MIKETRTTIYSNKIDKDIKLLLFSDIHYSGKKDIKKLDKLYNKLKEYDVNYICIPGDSLDSSDVLDKEYFTAFIKKISKIGTILLSIGNHDLKSKEEPLVSRYGKEYYDSLSKINNVYVLDNNSKNFSNIYFFGFTQSFEYYYLYKNESIELMKKELEEHKVINMLPNKYRVLLMHSPVCIKNNEIKNKLSKYDLVLCGHMHNGVILPGLDELLKNNAGLIAPRKGFFPKYARGIIKDKNIIVISGGITKIARCVNIPFRWLNIFFPMSINYITITNDKNKVNETFKYYK